MKTLERYIPANSVEIKDSKSSAVVYQYEKDNKYLLIAYSGKSGKPHFHYRYVSRNDRDQKAASFFDQIQRSEAERAKRQQEKRDFKHTLKVGDILNSSWGYDQTNVSFYMVTRVTAKSVDIVQIGSDRVEGSEGMMCCYVKPDASYLGERYSNKRVSEGNHIKLSSSEYASPYTKGDKGTYCSWYA